MLQCGQLRPEIMSNVVYEALWEQPFLMVPVV